MSKLKPPTREDLREATRLAWVGRDPSRQEGFVNPPTWRGSTVLFDDTADMLKQARFAMEFCAIESCGKCTPCRIGSTRGVETLDKVAAGIEPERNLELVTDLCNTMKFGSLCALGGFTPYPVMSALTHFPEDFKPRAVAEAAE